MRPEPALRVIDVGLATTFQDHGRSGWGHLGVPVAGAVDRPTHDLVNRLVGNDAGAATIETLGGLVVEALRPVVVARNADASRHILSAGERLRVDPPAGSLWGYLAVRGGIEVVRVLGSRSHDTLGRIGPPPIESGASLQLGPDPGTELFSEFAPVRRVEAPLRISEGPQSDWFADGLAALVGRAWHVSSDISRVGVRLDAGEFATSARAEAQMRSIGLVEGAIQITPSGEPIVMLANHPTTGGYPVIAVVDPDDLPALAQSRPGASIRFRP